MTDPALAELGQYLLEAAFTLPKSARRGVWYVHMDGSYPIIRCRLSGNSYSNAGIDTWRSPELAEFICAARNAAVAFLQRPEAPPEDGAPETFTRPEGVR